MTSSSFMKQLPDLPYIYHLDFIKLEEHLEEKFGDFEDHAVDVDGAINGTLDEEFVNYVKEVTKGAVTDVRLSYGGWEPWDDSTSLIYLLMDGNGFDPSGYNDCLFHVDEGGAFGPILVVNNVELENRAESRHYEEERERRSKENDARNDYWLWRQVNDPRL